MTERIGLQAAKELLDFTGGSTNGVISPEVAAEQLRGAVAVHNLLLDHNVAYLADEVGMGKTYVALGAIALLRHFKPDLRVLVIAPRQNIQDKWIKDWKNFTKYVVRVEDLRVKGVAGAPARSLVKVDSLVDLATHASRDPDRDFFMRLTSFSVPVVSAAGAMDKRRRQLLEVLPWLPREALNAQNKERYKRNFARAINCALPVFDLVVIDEGHNLKAGWREGSSSIRNTVIGCAIGGRRVDDDSSAIFKGYKSRAAKVLFLSATPLEHDFRQLWNQLDLLGFGRRWEGIRNQQLTDEERREVVRSILVRRTVTLHAGGGRLTKSEYRREWRGGGVQEFDQSLEIPGDRQRLAVALMQKKVTELMESGEHRHSFQVGLLASFESFLETAKVKQDQAVPELSDPEDSADAEGHFHVGLAESSVSRDEPARGFDIDAVNRIGRDHAKRFGCELPHPKMDALVAELSRSLASGQKALVFVRRVASVDELQRKLEEVYDSRLFSRLREGMQSDELRSEVEIAIAEYRAARAKERHRIRAKNERVTGDEERSGVDSFFAWFFRGDGPGNLRSGASLANQMADPSGNYSTLLEDNYVAGLLRCAPASVPSALAERLGTTEADAMMLVGRNAGKRLRHGGRALRRNQYRACQIAALEMLRELPTSTGAEARELLAHVFSHERAEPRASAAAIDATRWLTEETFFSGLRSRQALHNLLWPESTRTTLSERVREREQRRVLMAVMLRKGHPIIDLFIMIANRLGSLRLGVRESIESEEAGLGEALLDLLERQHEDPDIGFCSYRELSEVATHFPLLMQLNTPDEAEGDLHELPRAFGQLLSAQRPVAGMAGKVNKSVVKQFRMPGYPLILITTDLLKEGEDLHTFCSSVHHYGIAWMPSELEQRVGRVDRVGSQTERRLAQLAAVPEGVDMLQVYYPHLRDTVEVLQVNRVFERLNRFLRMMHQGLGLPEKEASRVEVTTESLRVYHDVAPIREALQSAFPVTDAMLEGPDRVLAVTASEAEALRNRFCALKQVMESLGARHVEIRRDREIVGEFAERGRVQPFVLLLRSIHGRPMVRCISPIGSIADGEWDDDRARSIAAGAFARVSLVRSDEFEQYDVAVEGDVLLTAQHADESRVRALAMSVLRTADQIEAQLLAPDATLEEVAGDLALEVEVER